MCWQQTADSEMGIAALKLLQQGWSGSGSCPLHTDTCEPEDAEVGQKLCFRLDLASQPLEAVLPVHQDGPLWLLQRISAWCSPALMKNQHQVWVSSLQYSYFQEERIPQKLDYWVIPVGVVFTVVLVCKQNAGFYMSLWYLNLLKDCYWKQARDEKSIHLPCATVLL